jgi:hypothetical protein
MAKLSYWRLEEAAKEWAIAHRLNYGRFGGAVQLCRTDARIAPYNYRLVKYNSNGGAYTSITEAMTAREMFAYLQS